MTNYPLMDITDRIPEAPKWWLQGIPRYCDYEPRHARGGKIEILVRVQCAGCSRRFDISVTANEKLAPGLLDSETGFEFWDAYVNPPFHLRSGTNCIGNTMGIEALEVLQAWEEESWTSWKRRSDLEGLVATPSWPEVGLKH